MINVVLKPDVQRPGFYILQDVRKLPEATRQRMAVRSHAWRPPTDVFETEEMVIVRVEIAGMEETDFTIVLDGRYLHIRGVRSDVPERRAYHQMEIRFGDFSSEVELPSDISLEHIEAVYSVGFLHIRLSKVRPVKIKVED
ncbi:MAG TPA: Hsp20/alpha crystallin family protein [Anaerolineales bacterium]